MKIPNKALWVSAILGFMLLVVVISWEMNRDIVAIHHLIIIPNIFNLNFYSPFLFYVYLNDILDMFYYQILFIIFFPLFVKQVCVNLPFIEKRMSQYVAA